MRKIVESKVRIVAVGRETKRIDSFTGNTNELSTFRTDQVL